MNAIPVPPEERSQWFSSIPGASGQGRDVYWCSRLNEPVIITFKDGGPLCTNCRDVLDDTEHTFLGHVRKPY